MTALLLSSLIVLLLAAFASGAEASLFSVSYAKAKAMADAGRSGGKALLKIKDNMTYPIGTIVIVNNVATIVGSTVEGVLAHKVFHSVGMGIFVALFTFCIIVFAEIVPKTLGESYAERIAPLVAPPVLFLTGMFRPLLWLIDRALARFQPSQDVKMVSEEEIKILAQMGHAEGSLEADESRMVRHVFKLNDITADDMMTPLAHVETLPGFVSLGEQRQRIMQARHSRLPVTGDDQDHILGVVLTRDMIAAAARDEFQATPADFLQEALRVHHDTPADDLLPLFQQREQHLAIVEDSDGRMVGVVTLEDVLEELVGEITDEKDIRPETVKRISKNEILADEGTDVAKVNHFFNTSIDFNGTLGDYLVEKLKPGFSVGTVFEEDELTFLVSSMSRTRPKRISLRKKG